MTKIQALVVSAAVAIGMAAPAVAAQSDPEVIIYRVPGVVDNNATSPGSATVFHCTNFSGVTETIRFVTRNQIGTLLQNSTLNIPHLTTMTAVTRPVINAYVNNLNLATGILAQGTTAIAATSINIICTAMTINASLAEPDGVALRAIRFNPVPGSQE